ncbi:MAG: hypothetical protein Q9228_003155 [Teloschistes exilis]
MSIDIDWDGLTTGPEGIALAESIKNFIHEKFQQVQLPGFIRSVEVHSFDFGKECPVVELKDICDPLSEFYDAQEEDDDTEEEDTTTGEVPDTLRKTVSKQSIPRPLPIDTRFSRSSTPGIPGGTSNLSYFHLPLSAGLSGTTTPLAAVALSAGSHLRQHSPVRPPPFHPNQLSPVQQFHPDPSSRPSTSDSYIHPPSSKSSKHTQPNPLDTQIVLHISYTGTVRLSITAEILLDYPMPSFVGIPLQLNITGLSFDGVALLAYLRKKAHFCFLTTEDAKTLVDDGGHNTQGEDGKGQPTVGEDGQGIGGLLKEIRVESEIGRQEGGKQVLRNVGKVEKFVLEQVRRIFEEEFVWPSFWTFLI